ncbi:MAG: YceI family protein [Acidobacteria bacterium]|nr:YceI family protein [Acidobacteriota bacterium]
MPTWTLEPGHSAAEFRARHMMVTWVRGHFPNVRGTLVFDPAAPRNASVEVTIDARLLCTGEAERDAHLRGADFLDVENHPHIRFRSTAVEQLGPAEFKVAGELTLRGVTRPVTLDARFLGQWQTPYWVGNEDKGPVTRAGFLATATINRQDFGVHWNAPLENGGVVVGNEVHLTLDVEALRNPD